MAGLLDVSLSVLADDISRVGRIDVGLALAARYPLPPDQVLVHCSLHFKLDVLARRVAPLVTGVLLRLRTVERGAGARLRPSCLRSLPLDQNLAVGFCASVHGRVQGGHGGTLADFGHHLNGVPSDIQDEDAVGGNREKTNILALGIVDLQRSALNGEPHVRTLVLVKRCRFAGLEHEVPDDDFVVLEQLLAADRAFNFFRCVLHVHLAELTGELPGGGNLDVRSDILRTAQASLIQPGVSVQEL